MFGSDRRMKEISDAASAVEEAAHEDEQMSTNLREDAGIVPIAEDQLIIRDAVAITLYHSLSEGRQGLSALPELLHRALEMRVWEERIVQATGKRASFPTFLSFLEARPARGDECDYPDCAPPREWRYESIGSARSGPHGETGHTV